MYKICFYVPAASAEDVKKAIFEAQAGKIGNYDSCCWQSPGIGQFRPLDDSNPAVGDKNKLNYVDEYKVELICDDKYLHSAINALINAHPYEEPAFQYWKIQTEI